MRNPESRTSQTTFIVSDDDRKGVERAQPARDVDRRFVDRLAVGGLLVVVAGQAAAGRTESDIWGHMAIGLDMLRERRFLWVDPYSFTHDQRWVNHEWLWDVVSAGVYRAAGLPGLVAMRALLIGAVLWVVVRATRRLRGEVRLLTLALVAVGCISQWRATRPQIATLAFYALLLPNIRARWLPLLFVVWANVHGGWIFGLGAVIVFATFNPTRRAAGIAVACAIATLVNPYGIGLWRAVADAMSRGWADVAEWQPIWRLGASVDAALVWGMLAVAAAWAWRRARVNRWAIAWTLVAFAAAASSRRLIALAAITAALLVVPGLPSVASIPLVWTRGRRLAAAVTFAACAAVALGFIAPTLRCFPPEPAWRAPEAEAVAFLRGAGVHRVLPHFDYGEYAIFQLRDRMQVGIDNRRETVYSARTIEENQRFADGLDPGYPDRIGADAVWWPVRQTKLLEALEADGWTRAFEGPRTAVLVRHPIERTLYSRSDSQPCFPNP